MMKDADVNTDAGAKHSAVLEAEEHNFRDVEIDLNAVVKSTIQNRPILFKN